MRIVTAILTEALFHTELYSNEGARGSPCEKAALMRIVMAILTEAPFHTWGTDLYSNKWAHWSSCGKEASMSILMTIRTEGHFTHEVLSCTSKISSSMRCVCQISVWCARWKDVDGCWTRWCTPKFWLFVDSSLSFMLWLTTWVFSFTFIVRHG